MMPVTSASEHARTGGIPVTAIRSGVQIICRIACPFFCTRSCNPMPQLKTRRAERSTVHFLADLSRLSPWPALTAVLAACSRPWLREATTSSLFWNWPSEFRRTYRGFVGRFKLKRPHRRWPHIRTSRDWRSHPIKSTAALPAAATGGRDNGPTSRREWRRLARRTRPGHSQRRRDRRAR